MNNHTLSHLSMSLLIMLATVGFAHAEELPRLERIKHAILSSTSEEITLQLNGPYSPKVFTLKGESPRLVLDFDDMTQGRGVNNTIKVNGPMIRNIRVGMHGDVSSKTRVVLDLKSLKGVNYTQHVDENRTTLTIRLTGPKPPDVRAVPDDRLPPQQPTKKTTLASKPQPAQAVRQVAAGKPAATPQVSEPKATASEKQQPTQPVKPQAVASKDTAPPQPTVAQVTRTQQAPKNDQTGPQPPQPSPATVNVDTRKNVEKKQPNEPQEIAKQPEKAVAAAQEQNTGAPSTPANSENTPLQPSTEVATQEKPSTEVAAQEKKTGQPQVSTEPELESIKFDPSSPKGEMVLFKLNGFFPPAVHGVEEGIPKVVCEFNNIKLSGTSQKLIRTSGKYVTSIRTTNTKKQEKIQVVIDLKPNNSYDLQQVFFKDDNLFVIIVNVIAK